MRQLSLAVKIISRAWGADVAPGDFVEIGVDVALGHDVTAPLAIKVMEGITDQVWGPGKGCLIMDHFVPAPTENTARQQKIIRDWAKQQGIKHFFEAGRGVCHQVIIEEGLVSPGLIIAGADSHTCSSGALGALGISIGSTELGVIMATGKLWLMVPETIQVNLCGRLPSWSSSKDLALYLLSVLASFDTDYKVVEFKGSGIEELTLADRITLCNMMAEAGAKTAIFEPDDKVDEYLKDKAGGNYEPIYSDGKAEASITVDMSEVEPMIAVPFSRLT